MVTFSAATWLTMALIGGAGLLGMLLGMALVVRNAMNLHEMRRKVARLRLKYAAEQAGQQGGEILEVDEVEEPGDVEIVSKDPPMAKAA